MSYCLFSKFIFQSFGFQISVFCTEFSVADLIRQQFKVPDPHLSMCDTGTWHVTNWIIIIIIIKVTTSYVVSMI